MININSTTQMGLLPNAPNFRSLGGIRASDGRAVKNGLVFRSDVLSRISTQELDRIRDLKIGMVCDLRSYEERTIEKNKWPDSGLVKTITQETQDNVAGAKPLRWVRRLQDPDFDEKIAYEMILKSYRSMGNTFAAPISALLKYCSEPSSDGVLIHCVAGKDRTGFACAILLWSLGVPWEGILADYLESRDRFALSGRMNTVLETVFGDRVPERAVRAAAVIGTVSVDYLLAAFEQVRMDFGSVEKYISDALKINPESVEKLRMRLLTD